MDDLTSSLLPHCVYNHKDEQCLGFTLSFVWQLGESTQAIVFRHHFWVLAQGSHLEVHGGNICSTGNQNRVDCV